MKMINLLMIPALAVTVTTACNKQSTEPTGNPETGASTNASTTASNVWQTTKENGSNLWDAAKSTATNAWDSTKEAGKDMLEKAKETVNGAEITNGVSTNFFGYAYSKKSEFLSAAQADLTALEQQSDNFSNRVANASESTKAKLQEQLDDLTAKRSELAKKYDEVKNASESDWNDTKAAFIKSYDDAKASLKAGLDSLEAKW